MTTEQRNPKEERRADARALREAMPETFRAAAAEQITKKILSMSSFRLCDTLLCYAANGSEVNLDALCEKALAMGKRVGFPVWDADGNMEFYAVRSLAELSRRDKKTGIRLPCEGAAHITPDHLTMILLPGLLFDKRGHRIGYGAGMYDTYIRKYPVLLRSALTVGVTYHALLSDAPVPHTDRDVNVALVVTEQGLTFARKVEKAPKWEVRQRRYTPLIDKEGNRATRTAREYYDANYVSPEEGKYTPPRVEEKQK